MKDARPVRQARRFLGLTLMSFRAEDGENNVFT